MYLVKQLFQLTFTFFVSFMFLFSTSVFADELTQVERDEMAAKLIPIIIMLLMDDTGSDIVIDNNTSNDSNNTEDDNSTNQEVNAAPTATATATPNTITQGEVVSFDASSSSDSDGNIVNYEWKEGSVVLSTQASFTKNDFTAGTHTITLTVKDDANATATDSVTVTVSILPNVAPTAIAKATPNTIAQGEVVSFDASSSSDSDGNIVNYEWKEGSVVLSTQASFTKNDFTAGAHTITLTVKDDANATATDSVTVTVLQLPLLINASAQVYRVYEQITAFNFDNNGADVLNCSVSPQLPSGLTLSVNGGSCQLSGIATVTMPTNTYTITGTNDAGDSNATVEITVEQNLLINEVSSAYYINDNRWFELYNPSSAPIDLSNYVLRSNSRDENGSYVIHNFLLPSKIMQPGGYFIIRSNHGPALGEVLSDIENNQVSYLKDASSKRYPIWFSDNGGFLEILKGSTTIDFVSITNQEIPTTSTAWSGPAVAPFTSGPVDGWKSIARNSSSSDTNKADDWSVIEFPTYAGLNDVTCNNDDDQDGIPDCSEMSGSTYAGIDLYGMGARVNQKDIFVEVDYMDASNGGTIVSPDEGIIPRQEAFEKLKSVFLDHNYTMHFDLGNLFSQNGAAIDPNQMDLGGGNEVLYATSVSLEPSSAETNVRVIKKDNFEARRGLIFYYMVYGTTQDPNGSASSSGIAELLGNDLLITFGSWGLHSNNTQYENILINYQAAVMMHELGHNFGLEHGGAEAINYKPNYLSIMNYLYALNGLPTIGVNEGDRYHVFKSDGCGNNQLTNSPDSNPQNFIIDYSYGSGGDLNESNIDEGLGLRHSGSGTVDFNCNNDSTENSLSFDLNSDNINTALSDHNDWDKIDIVFVKYSSGRNGVSLTTQQTRERKHPVYDDRQPVIHETLMPNR